MAHAAKPKEIKALTFLLFAIIFLFPFGQLTQIPFLPVRLYIQDVLVVSLWVVLLFSLNLPWLKKHSLFLPSVAFISISTVSLLLAQFSLPTVEVVISSLYLLRWIGYAGIGITSWLVIQKDPNIKQKILTGLLLVGTTASLFGLAQYVLYPDLRNLYYLGWDPHFLRVFGTFFDPNFLGLIITLTLIILATTTTIKTYSVKLLFWIINGLALTLTYSRGSYVAFFVSFIAFFYLQKKQKLILILLCIGVAILFVLPQSQKSEGVKLTRFASIESRIKSAKDGLAFFARSPILGVGFNTLKYYQSNKPQVFQGKNIPNNSAGGIENSFIFLLATTGIIGFAAYLWLLRNMFVHGQTVLKISLLAVCLHSLFNNSFFYPWIMVWLWFMVGTSLSAQFSSHSRQYQLPK